MSSQPPAIRPGQVAFEYQGVKFLFGEDGFLNLTEMWKANGSPANKNPNDWSRTEQGAGFIAKLAENLNTAKNRIWKSKRGKSLSGTWSHWQVGLAYAKYLSHDFHQFVNEVFKEAAKEAANPGLKMDRAIEGYLKQGKDPEWIQRRLQGKVAHKALMSTMTDHNCKVRGKTDNPFAEITRVISLQIMGKTPKEFKEAKGLPKSATTRDHFDDEMLVTTEWAQIRARKIIQAEACDGNQECVDAGRRAGKAVKMAIEATSIQKSA